MKAVCLDRHFHDHSASAALLRIAGSLLLAGMAFTSAGATGEEAGSMRTWTSAKGTQIEAALVRTAGGLVTLKKSDGSLVTIGRGMLSEADRRFLDRHSEKPAPKTPAPVSTSDTKQQFKKTGHRYWGPFEQTPIVYDYVAGLYRGGNKFFYLACVRKAGSETAVLERPIQGQRMGNPKWLFSSRLVNDVYLPKNPKKKAPFVQMARTCIIEDEKAGLVCLNSVFAGKYGSSPLEPALFSSKNGAPGTWTYHGKIKFDPPPRKVGRICEGAIVRAPNGNWRVYLVGYGVTVAVAESASLDGPWKFESRGSRTLIDVVKPLAKKLVKGQGACFPYALKVADNEYHLWVCEGWPCKAVWHLSSADGLQFEFYGDQPEILPTAAPGRSAMKGVRAFPGPKGETIHGFVPFHVKGKGWVIYESTMPVGLQPSGG